MALASASQHLLCLGRSITSFGAHLGRGITVFGIGVGFGFGFGFLILLFWGSHFVEFFSCLGRQVRIIRDKEMRITSVAGSVVNGDGALCREGNASRTRLFLTFLWLVLRKALGSGALSTRVNHDEGQAVVVKVVFSEGE